MLPRLTAIRHRAVSIAVTLSVVSGPFLPDSLIFFQSGFHDRQRVLEALCVTSVLIALGFCWHRDGTLPIPRFPNSLRYYCLIGFFLFGSISSLQSFSPRHAFFEWATFLLLVVTASAIAFEIRREGDSLQHAVLTLWGAGCAAYLCIVAVFFIATISKEGQFHPGLFIFGFDNPRFFNHAQTVSLPVLGLLVMRSINSRARYWFWYAVLTFWWAMLFYSAGRGTFVGVIVGTASTWIFRRAHALPWLRVMIKACLSGFASNCIVFSAFPSLLGLPSLGYLNGVVGRSLSNPTSTRTELWAFASKMILENPWLGEGPLHFAHFSASLNNAAHPHNWLLQIGAEWGLVSLFFLVSAVGGGYRDLLRVATYIKANDYINQSTLSAWITIATAILIDGLVSGLLVMPTSQMSITLFVGCAWGWALRIRGDQGEGTNRQVLKHGACIGITLVLLFALVMFWRGLYPEISQLSAYEASALKSSAYRTGMLRPRIWAAGFF